MKKYMNQMYETFPGSNNIEKKQDDQDIPQLNQSCVNAIIPKGTDFIPQNW
uniref:Uncharacterized protein n=1 Tax=Brassica oleracea var. oleracea TaxID=109376 RepID=A0A0D3ABP8_BRAOL